jgi:hypothetical protein
VGKEKTMSRSRNGTRMIEGREYLLAGSWDVLIEDDAEYVERQVKALAQRWEIVKVRTRYGFQKTAWVHGAKQ